MVAADRPDDDCWPRATVMVVDDEPGMRHFLAKALAPRVGTVLTAESAEAAEELLQRQRVDLLLLDIALPGKNGIALLKDMRAAGIGAEVVLITAFADLDTAIEALRAGAGDMLLKPFRVTQALGAVRHGLERARLRRENWVLRRVISQRSWPGDTLVGRSIVIKGLQAALSQVAQVDSTVLLTGESGTGKELAALALHNQSVHADGPFVPVNCATSAPAQLEAELFGHRGDGLFFYAQGGTLFLDEVDELPLPLQGALLRVLEDKRVRPIGSERAVPIEVPDDEMKYLLQYDWPGNVRELRNLIERSLIVGTLNVSALYQSLPRPQPPAPSPAAVLEGPTDLHELERRHILAVMSSVGGDKTRAAELLGISRRTLERRAADWAQP